MLRQEPGSHWSLTVWFLGTHPPSGTSLGDWNDLHVLWGGRGKSSSPLESLPSFFPLKLPLCPAPCFLHWCLLWCGVCWIGDRYQTNEKEQTCKRTDFQKRIPKFCLSQILNLKTMQSFWADIIYSNLSANSYKLFSLLIYVWNVFWPSFPWIQESWVAMHLASGPLARWQGKRVYYIEGTWGCNGIGELQNHSIKYGSWATSNPYSNPRSCIFSPFPV